MLLHLIIAFAMLGTASAPEGTPLVPVAESKVNVRAGEGVTVDPCGPYFYKARDTDGIMLPILVFFTPSYTEGDRAEPTHIFFEHVVIHIVEARVPRVFAARRNDGSRVLLIEIDRENFTAATCLPAPEAPTSEPAFG